MIKTHKYLFAASVALSLAGLATTPAKAEFSNGVYRCQRVDQPGSIFQPFFMRMSQNGPSAPSAHFAFYENLAEAKLCGKAGERFPCDDQYRKCSLFVGNIPPSTYTLYFNNSSQYEYEISSPGSLDPAIGPKYYLARCEYAEPCPAEY